MLKTDLNSNSVAVFKSKLKTFLLSQAYSSCCAHQHAVWLHRLSPKLRPCGAITTKSSSSIDNSNKKSHLYIVKFK